MADLNASHDSFSLTLRKSWPHGLFILLRRLGLEQLGSTGDSAPYSSGDDENEYTVLPS